MWLEGCATLSRCHGGSVRGDEDPRQVTSAFRLSTTDPVSSTRRRRPIFGFVLGGNGWYEGGPPPGVKDNRDSLTTAGRPHILALDWLHECALWCACAGS